MSGNASASNMTSEARAAVIKKPRFAIFLATACGFGYIPAAPGTIGSIVGVLVALVPFDILRILGKTSTQSFVFSEISIDPLMAAQIFGAICIALAGVLASSRAARYWQRKDPQQVVIDEVSGQHLALLLGSISAVWWGHPALSWAPHGLGFVTYQSSVNWKYLLLGFILFRVFDIWKPFPVRQAESLRGGWGIMADDWVAGIYAGLLLWAVRGFIL